MSVKRGRGRPPYQPSAEHRGLVNAMVGCGVPEAQIASVLGISPPTLRRHFKPEIRNGGVEANAAVAGSLFKIANDPTNPKCVTAQIFWLKCRAGWRELEETPYVGKKQISNDAARQAGRTGRFATPPGPRLAVNNAGIIAR